MDCTLSNGLNDEENRTCYFSDNVTGIHTGITASIRGVGALYEFLQFLKADSRVRGQKRTKQLPPTCFQDSQPFLIVLYRLTLGVHMQFSVGQPFSCMSDYHRII
jgi:hypothetical protein